LLFSISPWSHIHTLLTSVFLHQDIFHLAGNCAHHHRSRPAIGIPTHFNCIDGRQSQFSRKMRTKSRDGLVTSGRPLQNALRLALHLGSPDKAARILALVCTSGRELHRAESYPARRDRSASVVSGVPPKRNPISHKVWDSYDAIVRTCAGAWRWPVGDPDRSRSIASRSWARADL
jgi:hypothetical protein